MMTLRELLESLKTPCHIDSKYCMDKVVLFDSAKDDDMELLSAYYDDGDDVIRIDVGYDGE